jgi:glucosamine--fructose-6-phosphate aminotransferase (isomerizing)
MCGIVCAVAKRPIIKILLDGLKKLEYRGYDSAGIAVMDAQKQLQRLRVKGKVRELEMALSAAPPLHARMGIAHTRWATHGAPSEKNAHPFVSHDKFALVHNGIIENHVTLRKKLLSAGYEFVSETDTETAVHLIHFHFMKTRDFLTAVREAINELEGAYALGVFSVDYPSRVIGARQGAPLIIGKGQEENFIASDPLALISVTQQFIYLEDYDVVDITNDSVRVYAKDHQLVEREIHVLPLQQDPIERGQYRHYMKKEIMDQPTAITTCLEGRITKNGILPTVFGVEAEAIFSQTQHIQLVACGTSYHAALVARYWLESLAGIPCSVEIASEFRYRDIALSKNSLFVALSQSGETADTLAALRWAKKMGYLSTLAICNVPGSSMTREAKLCFLTRAGVEVGVASTKSFVTQLTSLFLLALALQKEHNLSKVFLPELYTHLKRLPGIIQNILQQDDAITAWAHSLVNKEHTLFLGRGVLYPIALEGALKMKELSYIHAEGYPAGELKHGPLALVDSHLPIIALIPTDTLLEKTLSNLQEVSARGGELYLLMGQTELSQQTAFANARIIRMPVTHALLTPILYTIPLQLLAYHVAVLKGTDVDQPRNLAKSVTVE